MREVHFVNFSGYLGMLPKSSVSLEHISYNTLYLLNVRIKILYNTIHYSNNIRHYTTAPLIKYLGGVDYTPVVPNPRSPTPGPTPGPQPQSPNPRSPTSGPQPPVRGAIVSGPHRKNK